MRVLLGILILGLSSCGVFDGDGEGERFFINSNDMLAAVNEIRSEGIYCGSNYFEPVPRIQLHPALTEAAERHAIDMEDNGFLSHTGSDGSRVGDRAEAAGYDWRTISENIARGQTSISWVMNSWIESTGHCENMMNPSIEDAGFARRGNYWVQVFGRM